MTKRTNKHKKAWTSNAQRWVKYKPPLRPSQQELKIIENFLKKIKTNSKDWQKMALILGATPEYRDLLAKLKYQVTMFDFNRDSVESMTLLLKHKGIKKEKLVLGNWLSNKFTPNTFDVVLADWSINNLPNFKSYNRLFINLQRIIKPGGFFINRTNVWSNTEKKKSVKEIMKKYQKNKKEKFSFIQMLQDYSNASPRNKRTFCADLEKFYHVNLPKAHKNGEMTDKEFYDFVLFFTQGKWRIKLFLTFPEKNKLEDLFKKYFQIIDIKYGRDYLYSRHEPIYILKKK